MVIPRPSSLHLLGLPGLGHLVLPGSIASLVWLALGVVSCPALARSVCPSRALPYPLEGWSWDVRGPASSPHCLGISIGIGIGMASFCLCLMFHGGQRWGRGCPREVRLAERAMFQHVYPGIWEHRLLGGRWG